MYDCDSPHANESHGRPKLLATPDGQVDEFVESLSLSTPTTTAQVLPNGSVGTRDMSSNEH